MGRVAVSVQIRAQARDVWSALTDWESQGDWITATTVRTVGGDGRGVGGRIEAFTGFGRFGFLDTMVVTEWLPPTWCAVRHTGRVVRGTGEFEVAEKGEPEGGNVPSGSIVTWREDLEIPGGRLGELAFALTRPAVEYAVLRCLKRFAAQVERERRF